ncbi:MAG: IS21 family transposase [Mesorhizobium sp.]|uniref:IS21 family transposase n=1 Tax=unclassified Mesorhizobium TaxID=325217 RepID=UPI000F764592|nr:MULTISPECIES: IS21 family transposase [unclassified Mesorhizobium]AZO52012.1 IS21 family transposase [Mesorhizobium sp. M4B.F.Ca.ET.058.02.1.1]RWD38352.1 MAG: IS21 family transposase [Mesorhizobium sp.]TIW13201.1 MAG: IS21 family transposase [Mesorhizobium sp.]TIW37423.1 MAG: IS21 family transposase [Mesorhizobium sp.]
MVQLGELLMILDLHRQGLSVTAIARRTGRDPKTVRKYIERGLELPAYGPRQAGRPNKIMPFVDYLRERVSAFPDLSAVRLTREIRERGYDGAYTAVKRFVAAIRPQEQVRPFEVRFETPAGYQAQIDFARFVTEFTDAPGVTRIVWLFSLVLGHSRYIFARYVIHQDLQTLLRCHMQAFDAIGGVPIEILYDRMKTAVTGEDNEGHIIYNRSLLALAKHFGFQPRACRPYRAKTKGKVERPFRYIREDFFLARSFRNLDDLNEQLQDWLDTVANARLHGTTQRIVSEAFAARRVSHDGLVSIGGNYYSVPDRTRRLVEVHQLADCIRILDEGRLVASHPVLEGRRQYRIDPAHRQGLARHAARKTAPDIIVGRLGDHVARRSLDFYQAVAERLAVAGSRS